MNKFAQKAKQAVAGSKVMEGREKMSTESVIDKYPDGITLTSFDIINGKEGRYPVFTFKEEPKRFIAGGAVLTQIVSAWCDEFDGDARITSDSLESEGGVKVRLYNGRNNKGQRLTLVEVLDD